MLKIIKILILMLIVLETTCTANATKSQRHVQATATATKLAKLSPEILNELKDFVNLIPQATVDEIVAKHYIVDGNFRQALKFLRSTQFIQLLQQAQQIPEVIEILDFLHLSSSGGNGSCGSSIASLEQATCEQQHLEKMTTVNVVEPPLDIVLLHDAADMTLHAYNVRTFSSFVEELMQHLPRDRYVQMINTKRLKSAAFADFYTALRSAQFRPMVEAAMKSANLAAVIKTLSAHSVDTNTLEPIAFEVLSWGPVV